MVLLTHRTAHLSSHSGQVAFPGGKADPGDADAVATALREAQEEIGLAAEAVEVIGTMPTYTTGSAFVVTPVVALVDPLANLVTQPPRSRAAVRSTADLSHESGTPPAPPGGVGGGAAGMVVHALPRRSNGAFHLGCDGWHVAQPVPVSLANLTVFDEFEARRAAGTLCIAMMAP